MWMTRRAAALFGCCSLLLIFAAGASADAGPHVQGEVAERGQVRAARRPPGAARPLPTA